MFWLTKRLPAIRQIPHKLSKCGVLQLKQRLTNCTSCTDLLKENATLEKNLAEFMALYANVKDDLTKAKHNVKLLNSELAIHNRDKKKLADAEQTINSLKAQLQAALAGRGDNPAGDSRADADTRNGEGRTDTRAEPISAAASPLSTRQNNGPGNKLGLIEQKLAELERQNNALRMQNRQKAAGAEERGSVSPNSGGARCSSCSDKALQMQLQDARIERLKLQVCRAEDAKTESMVFRHQHGLDSRYNGPGSQSSVGGGPQLEYVLQGSALHRRTTHNGTTQSVPVGLDPSRP